MWHGVFIRLAMRCCFLAMGLFGMSAQAAVQHSHAITLRGAPALAEGFRHFNSVNPDAPKGGRLRLDALGTFDSLNGFINKGVAAEGLNRLYDSLTAGSEDEFGTRYGLLAKRIIRDPNDASWVIYELRPEARFSDGHPLRAEDVVFTFETLLSEGAPAYKAYFADIASVTALSPLRVKFRFKHKTNRELPMTVGEIGILPKHYWATREFNRTSLEVPIGSGPYVISDIDPGRRISYARNPDYWARDLNVNRGRYNFDQISYQYYRDGSVAFEGFKANQYDVREENKAKTWATEYNFPAVTDGRVILQRQRHENPAPMQGFAFNTRRTPLNDLAVREALSLAFDFEWANRALFFGAYTRTTSFYANSDLAAQGVPSKAELALLKPWRKQLPAAAFGPAVTPAKSAGDGYDRANLLRAQALLKQAGWHYRDGALRDVAGTPMRLEMLLVQPEFERIVQPLRRNLARLGIDLSIRLLDVAQYIERLRQFDFDLTVTGVPASLSPGNELWSYWGSQSADTPGSGNLVGLKSPAVDALIARITQAKSRDTLVTSVHALDRVLRAQWLLIPQFHIPFFRIARWDFFGLPNDPPRYGLGLDSWWWKGSPNIAQER
ncbi:microcin C transport system substrate-binding protein [Paraperlucidibaca baekdonensis]|uniref:Microcin C transport system substrate-binding protein n=1 Tax=Paraperlucidibaca baekdonensis TaxID=748120 RepID=A0A3E0H268_9GAMM|nr:extracellular solute-binding protein [Paraperlucidibaca baekdonensis]REH36966.1 microcin C transport system substrate-binding protein [Paraperlucidibaca baekdonensis]